MLVADTAISSRLVVWYCRLLIPHSLRIVDTAIESASVVLQPRCFMSFFEYRLGCHSLHSLWCRFLHSCWVPPNWSQFVVPFCYLHRGTIHYIHFWLFDLLAQTTSSWANKYSMDDIKIVNIRSRDVLFAFASSGWLFVTTQLKKFEKDYLL